MAPKKKIQINVSTQSFSKLAGLVANSALLISNASSWHQPAGAAA